MMENDGITVGQDKFFVDSDGFIYIDHVKVARIVEQNGEKLIQFYDRDKRRAEYRGTPLINVPVDVLTKTIAFIATSSKIK